MTASGLPIPLLQLFLGDYYQAIYVLLNHSSTISQECSHKFEWKCCFQRTEEEETDNAALTIRDKQVRKDVEGRGFHTQRHGKEKHRHTQQDLGANSDVLLAAASGQQQQQPQIGEGEG